MTNTTAAVTLWAPRLAAIAMSLFLALFALDGFTGKALGDGLGDFAMHLAPSLLVLAVSAISWRYPLVGAAAFALFALAYAVIARARPDWVAVISPSPPGSGRTRSSMTGWGMCSAGTTRRGGAA